MTNKTTRTPRPKLELQDEVGPGQIVELIGWVSGLSIDRQITATMAGYLVYRDLNLGTTAICEARDHEVLFKRSAGARRTMTSRFRSRTGSISDIRPSPGRPAEAPNSSRSFSLI